MGLLERLLKAAEEGGRTGSDRNPGFAGARPPDARRHPCCSCTAGTCLALAEPEGYVRIFLDEGEDMLQLLRNAVERGIMPRYTGKLLSAFDANQQGRGEETPRSASPASTSLIEPLSQRELDILRLFKTELSGPEIARNLSSL
jgi:LuxR family transcriptional regulator, maltose regulon positive regulatory protein